VAQRVERRLPLVELTLQRGARGVPLGVRAISGLPRVLAIPLELGLRGVELALEAVGVVVRAAQERLERRALLVPLALMRGDALADFVQLAFERVPFRLPLITRGRRGRRRRFAVGVELRAGTVAIAFGVFDAAMELLDGLVQLRARGLPLPLSRAELLARTVQLVLQAGAQAVPDLTAGVVRLARAGEVDLELRARGLPRLPLGLQALVDFLVRGVVLRADLVELAAEPLDVVLRGAKLLLQIRPFRVAILLMAVERGAGVAQLGIERAGARLVIAARLVELAAEPLDLVLRRAKLLLQIRPFRVAIR
jgi:hypothetical protein